MALDTLIYRGAAPIHQEEFRYLAEMGVKTIISVDRAQPDRKAADSAGLRYVHIPIGYGKIERDAELDFLKAVRTLPGPLYVHCHGGKYRVGAMSALYRIADEGWTNDSAWQEMLNLGGKDAYPGLNYSVLTFAPPTREELAKHVFDPDKPPAIPKLAGQMGEISHLYEEMEKFSSMSRDTLEMEAITLALEERFLEIDRLKLCETCDSSDYGAFRNAAQRTQQIRLSREYSAERIRVLEEDCRACHNKKRDFTGNIGTALKMKLEKIVRRSE
jgi:protein tyrosine phosphatase (PTP) superfamily phosphohydrolase (DUF442 family)